MIKFWTLIFLIMSINGCGFGKSEIEDICRDVAVEESSDAANDEYEDRVTQLESENEDYENRISELESDNTSLEDRISILESDLEELKNNRN